MEDDEIFMMGFSGEEIKSLITTTTRGFTFNLDLLDHVLGSEAYQDEVGVWSRTEGMTAALFVYKAFEIKYGVSGIVRHSGNQYWVWKAPQHVIGDNSGLLTV